MSHIGSIPSAAASTPFAQVCAPGQKPADVTYVGAGDEIVTCQAPDSSRSFVGYTPPPGDGRAGLAALGIAALAVPVGGEIADGLGALGAGLESGALGEGLGAAASYGSKVLQAGKAALTDPAKLGEALAGGAAVEVMKAVVEHVGSAIGDALHRK